MFGFFIGAACLVGFAAVARGRHRHHGHGGWHHGRGHRGFGKRFFFRRILERLDTTPGQEKVIREAINDLQEEAYSLRSEVRGTRGEIAEALRAPELDKALLDRVFAKHDEVIEKLRASLLSSADRVHSTLDEQQRKQLADMIEKGPWGYAGC
ncbi:MAG TPA: periplasmic heavy metal sensor [Polyangiaceae bacterium]|nr:periplasmic heavy metal sensor [Polyangiaceae bacterium]